MSNSSFSDLSTYDNSWYKPGGFIRRFIWYFVNHMVLRNSFLPFSSLKVGLLKLFGARIGLNVLIKPDVNIKYPWFLEIGSNTWLGEEVWIDNLGSVKIGNNVCISQGAMLLCGNHNFKKSSFDLMVEPIAIEDGAWVGARALVCPGVIMQMDSVLTAGSIAVGTLEAGGVYQGNPAVQVKRRKGAQQ
ncbi:MAG: colanic acid biosynthesis acetyltransferase WcaF [Flavobacteriales bacterium]|nr:colanic acid biosynthesis acetyltransferase WcaF [Flavobacteriales bacterium]